MTRSGMAGMDYQQIAHALKNYSAKAPVIAPHYAMSGGSLNAPATDEIVMNPNAALRPPVSTDMSADVYKLMKLFPPIRATHPLGAPARRPAKSMMNFD